MKQNKFDFIIAGGGLAGLMLAYLLNKSILREKKILIIDREPKNFNDHTWCFWENTPGIFDEIVFRRWNEVNFYGTENFSALLDLENYQYKMIRAADFYRFVRAALQANKNFEFAEADIHSVKTETDGVSVLTDRGIFSAVEFVFDSFSRRAYDEPANVNLWQHFLGWTVETKNEAFESNAATLFDFRIPQNKQCRFVYVLPHNQKKALVEFTVFSERILEPVEYEAQLREYLSGILNVKNYTITEIEKGIIPMSDAVHSEIADRGIVRIGTAGGYVKPSTGYSFDRTQRRLKTLVAALIEAGGDFEKFAALRKLSGKQAAQRSWKQYLDSVLLDVLRSAKHPADDVFTRLFQKNGAAQMLRFLDEDTTLAEDLKIMQSVPLAPFSLAAIETAVRKIRRRK